MDSAERHNKAKEYLQELQSAYLKATGVSVTLFNRFQSEGGRIEDVSSELIGRLGEEGDALRSVPIGFLPAWDFNAMVDPGWGEPIIVVNWALGYCLVKFNEAVVVAVETQNLQPAREMALACAIAVGYGVHAVKWPNWESQEDSRKVINRVTSFQTDFILCHEFAHVLLGHMNLATTTRVHLPGASHVSVNRYNHSQFEEFDADNKAVHMLGKIHGDRKDAYYGTIYTLFGLMHLYEIIFSAKLLPLQERSHPPAVERWKKISEHWQWGQSQFDKKTGLNHAQANKVFFDEMEKFVRWAQQQDSKLLNLLE